MLIQPQDSLNSKVAKAKQAGYRLEVHAIGDRAAAAALDAFAHARLDHADRPIITHCQILGADLIERMARQHVIANIQPSFVNTDAAFAKERLPRSLQVRCVQTVPIFLFLIDIQAPVNLTTWWVHDGFRNTRMYGRPSSRPVFVARVDPTHQWRSRVRSLECMTLSIVELLGEAQKALRLTAMA